MTRPNWGCILCLAATLAFWLIIGLIFAAGLAVGRATA